MESGPNSWYTYQFSEVYASTQDTVLRQNSCSKNLHFHCNHLNSDSLLTYVCELDYKFDNALIWPLFSRGMEIPKKHDTVELGKAPNTISYHSANAEIFGLKFCSINSNSPVKRSFVLCHWSNREKKDQNQVKLSAFGKQILSTIRGWTRLKKGLSSSGKTLFKVKVLSVWCRPKMWSRW